MAEEVTIEQRLAILEAAVADLQRRLAAVSAPTDWLDRLIGSVSDEEAFVKALALGKAFRNSGRS